MQYRKNEKGRYEGVTERGEIIRFDDACEMLAFAEEQRKIAYLLGHEETVEIDPTVRDLFFPEEQQKRNDECKGKTVRFYIDMGVYDPSELLLTKEKALA